MDTLLARRAPPGGAGAGLAPLVTYLRIVPPVAKQGGEAVLVHTHRDRVVGRELMPTRARPTHFSPRCRSSLAASSPPTRLLGFPGCGRRDHRAGAARPGAICSSASAPLLERDVGRWPAALGVARRAGHVSDPGAQDAWFRLESHDARAILRAASEGVLFTEVERRLGFYLRALWGRSMDLARRRAAPAMHDGGGKTRSACSHRGRRDPHAAAFDVFPGQDGLAVVPRRGRACGCAPDVLHRSAFPLRQLKPIQVALVSLIEDARVEQLALREMPGLRRLWLPFHVAMPSFTRERRVADGAAGTRAARLRLSRTTIPGSRRAAPCSPSSAAALARPRAEPHHRRAARQRSRADARAVQLQDLSGRAAVPRRQQFLWDFGDAGQQQPTIQEVHLPGGQSAGGGGRGAGRTGNGAQRRRGRGRRGRADRAAAPAEQQRHRRGAGAALPL